MPIEYAEIILAIVALFAGILYLRVRRTRSKGKKNKNAVRPASPSRTGMASQPTPEQAAVQTWAPPVATPRPGSVASRSEEHTSELQSPCKIVCSIQLE